MVDLLSLCGLRCPPACVLQLSQHGVAQHTLMSRTHSRQGISNQAHWLGTSPPPLPMQDMSGFVLINGAMVVICTCIFISIYNTLKRRKLL